jgi:putative ABC transport system permease protein
MVRPGIRRLFHLALRRADLSARDVDEEIRTHLQLRTEQLMRDGMAPEIAHEAAVQKFGSFPVVERELHHVAHQRDRTMRLQEWFEGLRQDVRYAARALRREPMFTAFVVTTLALGIGANAAMFGVVDRLLIRGPAHITDPARVMRVYYTGQSAGGSEFTSNSFGYVTYGLLKSGARSLEGVAAYAVNLNGMTFGRGGEARLVTAGAVTADLFPLLGVRPALGRFFTADEDRTSGAEHVVVLGDGLWRSDFAGDRSVLGRTIVLGDEPFTVVGVAPPGFTGPQLAKVDVWTPMSLRGANVTQNWATTWNAAWLRVIARVKPGMTTEQVNADATAAYRHAYSGSDKLQASGRLFAAPISFNSEGKETAELSISRWLLGVAIVVLLIACSNVVNLLLARAVRRRREVAVRLALGAGRGRLVRLLLTESMMLAIAGGVAGLVIAWVTAQMMRKALLPTIEWTSPPVDARVLAVSAAIALGVGILVGLAPALRASRPDLTASLKAGVREGGGQGMRLRSALTIAQAALSIVLLVGAGLFVRSLWHIRSLDLGIEPDKVLAFAPRWPGLLALDTAARRIERARRNEFYSRALERVRQLSDVEHASLTVGLPFQSAFSQFLRVPGWDSIPAQLKGGKPGFSAVASDYFETVGTRLVSGRTFTPADRNGSEPVALVSDLMAKTLWPGRSPIGDCLFAGPKNDSTLTCSRIVGIVRDARQFSLKEDPSMKYYIPFGQERGVGGTVLLIRPRGDPAKMVASTRRVLQELDPSISYVYAQTLQESVDPQIRPWRLGASVFGLMGVLALVVAAVGLYSVLSYLVAQRTHEIGVRIALGARGGDILGLVLRSSFGMTVLGVVIGLALSLAAGRFVEPLLFETSARDPGVIGGVALSMLTVALVASLVPALRARRVNPMEALRTD